MNFDTYQRLAIETDLDNPMNYYFLGLVEEAGEVAGLRKRFLRDEGEIDRNQLVKELGDVLWYIALIAKRSNITFEEVGVTNIQKLLDRKTRGVIRGNGDAR